MAKKKKKKGSKESQISVIFLLIFIILLLLYFSRTYAAGNKHTHLRTTQDIELPHINDTTFIIKNIAARYTLLYDTSHRQAAWVAYILTAQDVIKKTAERQNRFIADPYVKSRQWPTALTSHYTKSGYDRGHLLPSADRCGSQEENDATFHLSNISPQHPALNRGVWKHLEDQIRKWAERYDSLHIVTGGLLVAELKQIKGRVGVPEYFYKALLVKINGEYHSVGFIFPNNHNVRGSIHDYMVTVDSVENFIGYDLFSRLPDSIQNRIESTFDKTIWKK